MTKTVYLDQNAWIALAHGAWDKDAFPRQYGVLTSLIGHIRSQAAVVPLSFENIYETFKINDPIRRNHIAYVQIAISKGIVFRGRRKIFTENLKSWILKNFLNLEKRIDFDWYLSDIWFESAHEFLENAYKNEDWPNFMEFIKANPQRELFRYLTQSDDIIRKEAIKRFSASSDALIQRIETRRLLASGESLAIRQRTYAANQIIDEIDFIFATGRQLGQPWYKLADIGSSMIRRLSREIPVLHVEKELAVRLEDQDRQITENDLRDMSAFFTVLPLADIMVAEKQFINLAIQARLGHRYKTELVTSIFSLPEILTPPKSEG